MGTLNLGYDSRTDTLFGTSTGGDSLYVVNRQTGAFTLVANLQNSINPQALAYDSQVGTLYLLDNNADQLFAIDTTTGQAHALGSTGVTNNLLGLAYVPGGTGSTISSPERPVRFEPSPCCPRSAFHASRYV
jgi:hypothetical protein